MPSGRRLLRTIAVFKLVKALVLLGSLAMLFNLIRRDDPASSLLAWAMRLHVDPDNRYLRALLAGILGLNAHQLELLAAGTVLYALLFAAEGVGLLFEVLWAEYLTIAETAGFVPLELYEIIIKTSAFKIAVLAVNIFIVMYLVRCVQRGRRGAGS